MQRSSCAASHAHCKFNNTQNGIKTDGFQNRKFWGLSKLAILVHQQLWCPFGWFFGTQKRIKTGGFQNGKFWRLSKLAILVHQRFWCSFGCFRICVLHMFEVERPNRSLCHSAAQIRCVGPFWLANSRSREGISWRRALFSTKRREGRNSVAPVAAAPKRSCSKRGWMQKHANERKRAQKSANERKRKSTKERKTVQKSSKQSFRVKIANNQV